MNGKGFTGLLVGFWLVMMTALVRMEYFPTALRRDTVPAIRVMSRIFANGEPLNMYVYYQNKPIGACKVDIAPQTSLSDPALALPGKRPGAYIMTSTLWLDLVVFGTPSRFTLNGRSRFDNRFEVQDFSIKTSVGKDRVNLGGDTHTKKVLMTLDAGDTHEQRQFNYVDLKYTNVLEALGLPSLPGFGGLGLLAGMMPSATVNRAANQPITQVYRDKLLVGGLRQPAFVIESKLNQAFWAKIWVDEAGSVLQVDTSVGLTMRSVSLESLSERPSQLADALQPVSTP
jgi:hypothetical protein